MTGTRIEIGDHLSAWHLDRSKLPRAPRISPLEILEAGLESFPSGPLVHADIGTGRGEKLDEVAAIAAGSALMSGRLESWGSEIFLYNEREYRRNDPRVISPDALSRKVRPESAALVSVIAPDPFTPNMANQVLSGISLLHPHGLIFLRSEKKQEALGMLLGAGFTVADLGTRQELLRSRYIPQSRLLVGWKNNPGFESFLHDNGIASTTLAPGEERLKLLGWTLQHCGMHRNIFPIAQLSDFSGLEPMEIGKKVDSWSDFRADPYLRRFERYGAKKIIY